MNTIVFVVETPVLIRDILRFEIDVLKESGITVVVLELSKLLQPYASNYVKDGLCDYKAHNVIAFKRWNDFEKVISENKNSSFVVKLGNGPYTHKLYKILRKYKIRYGLLLPEISPAAAGNQTKSHLLHYFKKISTNPLKSIKGSIYKRLINYLNIQPASVVYYSGDGMGELHNLISNYRISKDTVFKSIASVALIECEKVKNQGCDLIIEGEYILFIDQGLPVHPDAISAGGIVIPATIYYEQLNWFLKELSSKYSTRVVIALHPRVNYKDNPFDNSFQCIKGKTTSLVNKARVVVYHFSEALNYIVYFRKPIIPITLNCINERYGYSIKIKTNAIKAPIHNISDYFDNGLIPDNIEYYSELSYSNYLNTYMPTSFDYPSISAAIIDFINN